MAAPPGRPQSSGKGFMGGPMGPGPGGMGMTGMGGMGGMGMTGMGGAQKQATLRPGTMSQGPGGMGGIGGVPPQTGRVPTQQGQRPGSGLRTRQGTAQQQQVLGVGAHTEVKVTDRPMTMQGVMGMKTGNLGPKRQIYDKSYYMGELRKKCSDLTEEVTKLNKEINDIQQDNQLYASLEKRYDSLVKMVRTLEGDLADHNLATDKQRTDTRPEEVHHMYMIMKSQNEQQRNDIDDIFLEKRRHEEEIQGFENEINGIARAAEDRLNELHPDQRHEYEALREENHRLSNELQESREELDQVNVRLNSAEGRLRSDLLRTRYQQLTMVRKELAERLEGLEAEVKQCSMSIPEQRELLLSKVKNDNAEIVAAEKRNEFLKLEIEKLRTQIRDVTAADQERKDEDGGDTKKYEILFTKDHEMTTFIESFDENMAQADKNMKEKQENICRLLENISKSIALPTDLSPEAHHRDLEEELDFKNRQLHNSESTQQRLEAELSKREGELEKIESLDVKISLELQQVEQKMKQYENDIQYKYDLVADMRVKGEEQLRRSDARKKSLEARVAALRQQVNFLKLKESSKRQQLKDDEVAANLEQQEAKIRSFGQTLYTLKSFIQQKSSESNFSSEMANCMDMAGSINKILQDQMQRPAPCA